MTTTRIEFDARPSAGSFMLRAALGRKAGLRDGESLQRFESAVNDVPIEGLAEYQAICGFPASDTVPLTMPQVVAAPLHLAVLTHSDFPMPAMGLVHVASRITQQRPLRETDRLAIVVWVEGQRQARKGCEIDLVTEVRTGGELVWESITTVLSTAAKGHGNKTESPPVPEADPTRSTLWTLPSDLGRRYGTIAGIGTQSICGPLRQNCLGSSATSSMECGSWLEPSPSSMTMCPMGACRWMWRSSARCFCRVPSRSVQAITKGEPPFG